MKKLKSNIKKRIKKFENEKEGLSNAAKTKYNYALGELQWILNDLEILIKKNKK